MIKPTRTISRTKNVLKKTMTAAVAFIVVPISRLEALCSLTDIRNDDRCQSASGADKEPL